MLKTISRHAVSALVASLLVLGFFWALTTRVATGISVGSYTLNAYLTLIAAILASLLFALTLASLFQRRNLPANRKESLRPAVLVAALSSLPLLVYSLASLSQSQLIAGLQNILVWLIFSAALFGLIFNLTNSHLVLIRRGLLLVAVLLPASKIIPTLGGFDFQGQSTFAITALIVLAWTVSVKPETWLHHVAPWWVFLSILLAEVRMAGVTAAAIMLFLVRHLPLSRAGQFLAAIPVGLVSILLAWQFLGDKFLRRSSEGEQLVAEGNPGLGALEILGTSERGPGWVALVESLGKDFNFWGQGAGKATVFFLTEYPLGHAHNEYLRIFYDFGWAGLALFLLGALSLFLATVSLHRRNPNDFSFASLLTISSVAVLSATDNPVVYVMAMLPAAIAIGSAFATERMASKPRAQGPL